MAMTVSLPEPLAAVLAAEAARRGQTPDEVAADLLADRLPETVSADPVEAFIGAADSGDAGWAGRDSAQLRAEAAARKAS
jgi:hypothetical protein